MVTATELQAALNDEAQQTWVDNWLDELGGTLEKMNSPNACYWMLHQAMRPHLRIIDTARGDEHGKVRQFKKELIRQHVIDPSVFNKPLVEYDQDKKQLRVVDWLANALVMSSLGNDSDYGLYPQYIWDLDDNTPTIITIRPDEEEGAPADNANRDTETETDGLASDTDAPPAANPEAAAADAAAGTETGAPPEA